MPRLLIVLAVMGCILSQASQSVAQNKWYSGGNLHKATVGEWRAASDRNQLATAADWAIVNDNIERKVRRSGTVETVRPYAVALATCVDESAGPTGNEYLKVSELAALCMILMGW